MANIIGKEYTVNEVDFNIYGQKIPVESVSFNTPGIIKHYGHPNNYMGKVRLTITDKKLRRFIKLTFKQKNREKEYLKKKKAARKRTKITWDDVKSMHDKIKAASFPPRPEIDYKSWPFTDDARFNFLIKYTSLISSPGYFSIIHNF